VRRIVADSPLKHRRRKSADVVVSVALWLVILFVYLVPFYYVIVNSLKNLKESTVLSMALPTEWRFDNFIVAFVEGKMLRGFLNSVFVAALVVAVVIVCSALASFYIQRSRTRISTVLYYFFVAGIALPISVVTTFGLLKTFHLLNRLVGASAVYAAMRIPFVVFIYVGFLKSVPRELDDAAVIDGCSGLNLFFRVILPLLKPITATCIVLTAQFVWNSFDVILYFIQSSRRFTLPLSIYNFAGMYTTQWNLIFAGAIITVLPVLVLYLLGQKYIVAGLTSGAVKA
jgi:raffinose/stachyose/melibiose transport system permease protein